MTTTETAASFAIRPREENCRAFSLVEVICVIVIIGVLTAVAIPVIQGLDRVSVSKSKRNAQMTAEVSGNLNSLGVAHVLPGSLGGAQATARLIQMGVTIPSGEMEGAYLGLPNLPVSEIESTAQFLQVVFDDSGLRLEYVPDADVFD